jgi:hypothetical protein
MVTDEILPDGAARRGIEGTNRQNRKQGEGATD